MLAAAAVSAALAVSTGASAGRRGDPRLSLVSLAFLAAAGSLGLHALATPGVLLETSNVGFAISTPIGLLLAAVFAAASSADLERSSRTADRLRLLQRVVPGLLGVWAVVSLALLPRVEDPAVPERGSAALAAPAAVAVALYALAVGRYARLYARRPSPLLLAVAAAFVLLAEAALATAASRNWHATWWEWHVLMLAAFALVAAAARREWHEERYSPLYTRATAGGELDASVLFADLAGFTAFAERREPQEVTAMLNTYFEAVLPEIERHGGTVDRLIGDAVMAVFDRDADRVAGHALQAARAALAFQRAATRVARDHPGWPGFRVGVNTGKVSTAVLGTAGGRTYSVVGDTVNLASRLEGLAPVGGVAVGAATAAHLRGAHTEHLGRVAVKGHAEPVDVHLLLALDSG